MKHGDHPRSRGVYRSAVHLSFTVAGSSPLARGLRPPIFSGASPRRIIPARAGFTPERALPVRMGPDHPRSRGVYSPRGLRRSRSSGSSPLARGLPGAICVAAVINRIIPARAGFTATSMLRTISRRDHPRSRGVYYVRYLPAEIEAGSSPLARGLQMIAEIRGPLVRIIPARAGFTHDRMPIAAGPLDHPRSRGVYQRFQEQGDHGAGSSPLARGLRDRRPSQGHRGRIIPARAGFTWAS